MEESDSHGPMQDPTITVMDQLARTSGVVGVERLAALFMRREPAAARTMSVAEVKKWPTMC